MPIALMNYHPWKSRLVLLFTSAEWTTTHGQEALDWLIQILGKRSTSTILFFAVTALGGLAYFLKRKRQLEYGMVEIGFGGIASMIALANIDKNHFINTLVTVAGCVYVTARGFNNMADGKKDWEDREDEKEQKRKKHEAALFAADIVHLIERPWERGCDALSLNPSSTELPSSDPQNQQ